MMHSELLNLSLFVSAIAKVLLMTGVGVAIFAAFLFERYPLLQSRGLQLLADWRIWARNGGRSQETVGNRVSPTRTAQRRVDDLTNAGAPWERVEASRKVSGSGQLAIREKVPASFVATSPARKVRRYA